MTTGLGVPAGMVLMTCGAGLGSVLLTTREAANGAPVHANGKSYACVKSKTQTIMAGQPLAMSGPDGVLQSIETDRKGIITAITPVGSVGSSPDLGSLLNSLTGTGQDNNDPAAAINNALAGLGLAQGAASDGSTPSLFDKVTITCGLGSPIA